MIIKRRKYVLSYRSTKLNPGIDNCIRCWCYTSAATDVPLFLRLLISHQNIALQVCSVVDPVCSKSGGKSAWCCCVFEPKRGKLTFVVELSLLGYTTITISFIASMHPCASTFRLLWRYTSTTTSFSSRDTIIRKGRSSATTIFRNDCRNRR